MLRLLAWLLLVLYMCIFTPSTPSADAAAREVAVAPLLVRRCRNWSVGRVTALRAHRTRPHLSHTFICKCHEWSLLSGRCCSSYLTCMACHCLLLVVLLPEPGPPPSAHSNMATYTYTCMVVGALCVSCPLSFFG